MRLRICICCGERMSATGEASSRNPNVCSCCSSLLDGMEGSGQGILSGSALPGSLEGEQQAATSLAAADAATADSMWVYAPHQP
jgi:hypothetical protein